MKIFEVENTNVTPAQEVLLIFPFKDIWARDKSKKKTTATRELAYVEFMVSPKSSNPFAGYPENIKSEKIIETLFKGEDWHPDVLVGKAIETYITWLDEAAPSYRFYLAVKKSVDNLRQFLESVDLDERDEKGKPIFKVNEVLNAQTKASEVLKNLNTLKKNAEQEIFESTRTQSNKEINHFER